MTETLPSNEPKVLTLPPTWEQAKLGDILTMEYGKGLPKAKRNAEGNVPVYGSSGIAGYHDQSLNSNPCLIVGRKGSAGSVHLSKKPCWTIDTAYYIEPPNGIDLAYLFYLLRTAGLNSLDKSTAVPSLSRDDAYSVGVAIAPTNEQRRIVEKIEELFTKLDAGVRSLEQARAQLKSYRRSVLKAAVEGELSREWREAHGDELEPASELLERILQERREKFAGKKYKEPASPDTSELSMLPSGWEWASIQQIADTSSGGTPSRKRLELYEGDIPWVKSGELRDNVITGTEEHISDAALQNSSAKLFPKTTLLIALYGATIGQLGILGTEAATNQAVCAIFLPSQVNVYYTFYVLIHYRQALVKQGKGGAQPNISQGIVRDTVVPLPPLTEQRYIVDEVERRLSVVDKLEATVEENLKQAGGLRQSILKRAFSGELVPQDPDDEPAGVLLARVRADRRTTEQKARRPRRAKNEDGLQERLI